MWIVFGAIMGEAGWGEPLAGVVAGFVVSILTLIGYWIERDRKAPGDVWSQG